MTEQNQAVEAKVPPPDAAAISWTPVVISFVVRPICLLIAAFSGGVGHGSYTVAIVLFSYAALFGHRLRSFL